MTDKTIKNFEYRQNEMMCEDVRIADIAQHAGTPVFIYSKRALLNAFHEFDSAFTGIDHLVCYSMKANSNLNVCRIFYTAGSGVDCNSGGEFFRALKAGVDPQRIIFTGVGKTEEEMRMVLQYNVMMIKVESQEELHVLNDVAGSMSKGLFEKKIAPIGIRVNPDVDPKTHPYISTGLSENKFGIEASQALNAYELAASLPNLRIVGIDMHIGSQITKVEPFVEACNKMAELAAELKRRGITLQHFDIGGGLGVSYNGNDSPTPKQFAEALTPVLKKVGCKILFEPGRFLTANAGVLVTKVLYTKQNKKKNFVIVDAAMNDLLRPSLYNAFHEIKPVRKTKGETITADIVGPVCESGDFLAKNREIQKSKRSELLAVMSAGAYGFVMSSNYNSRRRAAEVIVDGGTFFIARERETFDDLVKNERLIKELI
jgi:diaminopimelate decarboxylase